MKKALILLPLALVLSCSREMIEPESYESRVASVDVPERGTIPGEIIFKADDELCSQLEEGDGRKVLEAAGIISAQRMFPDAGKFEKRTREMGLHHWYIAKYDKNMSATKASAGLALIDGIEKIELSPAIKLTGDPHIDYSIRLAEAGSSSVLPFDDPDLGRQWHYYNNGKSLSAVSGCDINVVPIWKRYTTGDPDIVVGVVDEGIDFKHEDLAENMWENPEKTGDLKYGYNFVNNSYGVTPGEHGTHVAGTIAAVNNNGKGCCGIAGGDKKKKQKGVKVMSCQIFEGKESGSGASAIKWSADHGAIISQNSWGYVNLTSTPDYLKDAVDYFIKYAGVDKDGNQVGPMKGGIVIFAAGNENSGESSTSYNKIFNVASVGSDYRRAYYSNYGDWVDIAAPGGDVKKGNAIYSTLPGNKYGTMQGTSMACPHVSGVAALVVAAKGKKGYTAATLEKDLIAGVTDISTFNPAYYVGKGLVNTYMSIAGKGGKAPAMPTGLTVDTQANNVNFSVKVPADEDDGTPMAINLYYSKEDFTEPESAMFASFYVEELAVGETLSGSFSGLDFDETYYVAAAAVDLAGNRSSMTGRTKIFTKSNSAPVIDVIDGTQISLKPHESAKLHFKITDPDSHFYFINLDPGSEAAVLDTTVRENPIVAITAAKARTGSYTARLSSPDMYGDSTYVDIKYTVLENHEPYKGKEFEDIIFNSRKEATIEVPATDYFKDDDGEALNYDIKIEGSSANMTYDKGNFYITPMNYGYSTVTVTGSDVRGASTAQSFRILVRDSSSDVDVYPNPVSTNLSIRTGKETTVSVKIINAAGGVYYEGEAAVSAFEPAKIDMTGAPVGIYTVVVTIDGKENKYTIAKI